MRNFSQRCAISCTHLKLSVCLHVRMDTVREKWTDERMDDLNHRVDEGFRESREEMRALRTESREEMRAVRAEMNSRFDAVDSRFDAIDSRFSSVDSRFDTIDKHFGSVDSRFATMDSRFDAIDSHFDAMQRTMIQGFVGMTAAIVAALIGLIATQL